MLAPPSRLQAVGGVVLVLGVTLMFVAILSLMVCGTIGAECPTGPIPEDWGLPAFVASWCVQALGLALWIWGALRGRRQRLSARRVE